MAKRYIILRGDSFRSRDWDRFGCRVFAANGFQIVAVQTIDAPDEDFSEPVLRCHDRAALDRCIGSVAPEDIVLNLIVLSPHSMWIYDWLRETTRSLYGYVERWPATYVHWFWVFSWDFGLVAPACSRAAPMGWRQLSMANALSRGDAGANTAMVVTSRQAGGSVCKSLVSRAESRRSSSDASL